MRNRIDIACEYIRHTEKAIQVFDGTTEEWVPFSQIIIRDDSGRPPKSFMPNMSLTLNMPEWLAKEKGFV